MWDSLKTRVARDPEDQHRLLVVSISCNLSTLKRRMVESSIRQATHSKSPQGTDTKARVREKGSPEREEQKDP